MNNEYIDVIVPPTEEMRDPTKCYGVVGTSVWYCPECEQVLNSNVTPHLKPLPRMPVEVRPLRHKMSVR